MEYKARGFLCSQYWYEELKRILTAKWHLMCPSFQALRPQVDYVLQQYPNQEVLDVTTLTLKDRKALLTAYCNELGMHTNIFPYRVEDFDLQPEH